MDSYLVKHMQKLKNILYKQSIFFALTYSILLLPTVYISNYILGSHNTFNENVVINSLFLIIFSTIVLICFLEPISYLAYKKFYKKAYADFLSTNKVTDKKICPLNCFNYIYILRKAILHKLATEKLLVKKSKPLSQLLYSSISAIILSILLFNWDSYLPEISLIFKLIMNLLLLFNIRCIMLSAVKLYFHKTCQDNKTEDTQDKKKIIMCLCNEITKEEMNKIFHSRIRSALFGITSIMLFGTILLSRGMLQNKNHQIYNNHIHNNYILMSVCFILGTYFLQKSIYNNYYLKFYFPIKSFYNYHAKNSQNSLNNTDISN